MADQPRNPDDDEPDLPPIVPTEQAEEDAEEGGRPKPRHVVGRTGRSGG